MNLKETVPMMLIRNGKIIRLKEWLSLSKLRLFIMPENLKS